MALTPEQEESNRREDELVKEQKRQEEEELKAEGLWGRPLTAEDRVKKHAIADKWREWANRQRSQFRWF